MKALYEATAKTTGGRMGHVKTTDGLIDMKLSLPKSLGGPTDDLVNPEQFFAAGYSACFGSALDFAAGEKKMTLENASVEATVGIGKNDAGGFALKVKLVADLPRC
jgi:osmotically inducible protein OsmC